MKKEKQVIRWFYGCEVKIRNSRFRPPDIAYLAVFHFETKREREAWIQKKPFNYGHLPLFLRLRRRGLTANDPLVQAAKNCGEWPCRIKECNGRLRVLD